jgi:quercetin dioxygenase-like cupin family protein
MKIIRWHDQMPPQEQVLRKKMQQQGLQPYTWSNGPGDTYAPHMHDYEKVLYCVRGSIRFTLPTQLDATGTPTYVNLGPGDCMILPAGTCHSAQVGSQGVTCLEAAAFKSLLTPAAVNRNNENM